jgi:hypothetical protein
MVFFNNQVCEWELARNNHYHTEKNKTYLQSSPIAVLKKY